MYTTIQGYKTSGAVESVVTIYQIRVPISGFLDSLSILFSKLDGADLPIVATQVIEGMGQIVPL